ncbi:unannotated protein [freshwater metagenome]|uniref:Unannotated protein n=1 Tax=freshwater metagenome TaxID=449393 RepID=A0A6J6UBE8_9ZZZZ
MGEDGAVIRPVALALRDACEVDLAHRHDRASLVSVDLIAIDIELVVERVVATDLLQLVVGRRDDSRVKEPDIRQRPLTCLEHGGRRRVDRAGVVGDLGIGDVVGSARGIDVALDVRGLADELARSHLELLDDDRVDRADDDAREDHQAKTDDRDRPGLAEDVRDEQDSHDERNEGEDVERRQHRVDIGVLQAGESCDEALALDRQAVAVEPVRGGLEEQQQRDERRELDLSRLRCAIALRLQPEPAVQVLHDHGGDDRDEEHCEPEAEQEPDEGEGERVERQVKPELGIIDPEVGGIAPQQVRAPLARGREAGEQSQDDRDHEHELRSVRLDGRPVSLEARLLGRHAPERRPGAPCQPHDEDERTEHQAAESAEQNGPGDELRREDLGLVDRVEPQEVGVEAREDDEGDDDHPEHDERREEHPASPLRWPLLVCGLWHLKRHILNLRHAAELRITPHANSTRCAKRA